MSHAPKKIRARAKNAPCLKRALTPCRYATATFYHTINGGQTWTAGTGTADMLLMYAIAIDCVPNVNCWVNMLDILTQESSIAVLKA